MQPTIHPIKLDFQVTPTVRRYVWLYLIQGQQGCYLIDAGVAGAETAVAAQLRALGRDLTDLKGIFLTHAHPDHMGGAAALREKSGCLVYASAGERPWIEDIDLQFQARPIPNFYTLLDRSVPVDRVLAHGDRVALEPGLTLEVVGTPGHAAEELSYLLPEARCVFTGDAIPVRGDIPIWVHRDDARQSLRRLGDLPSADTFYPAWDVPYDRPTALEKLADAEALMDELQAWADRCRHREDPVQAICDGMQTPHFLQNPLFRRTVQAMLCARPAAKRS